MKNVAYFFRGPLYFKNMGNYHRVKALARKYRLCLFNQRRSLLRPELAQTLHGVYSSPRVPIASLDSILYLFYAFFKFLWLHRRQRFDILWTLTDQSLVLGYVLKLLLGKRVRWVVDDRDDPRVLYTSSRFSVRYLLSRAFFTFTRHTLKYADFHIVVGTSFETGLPKVLIEDYRLSPSKMLLVTNGVDLNMFRPRGQLREDSEFRILYVGLITRDYGVDVLVEAVARLVSQVPELRLRLAGWPANQAEERWFREAVKGKGLEAHISWLGTVEPDEIPGLIEGSDVCVYPFPRTRVLDGVFPVKVYEALAMGRCVVASALTGVGQIIRQGENGLLVEPGKAEALAQGIYQVYRDKPLRAKLEANARQSVEAYSWDSINEVILRRVEAL